MKNIFKYITVLMVVLLLTSCEKFLDVNVDPNNPTVVSPDLVLPTAMKYTGELMSSDRRISHLGNMLMANWSQSDGYSWYTDEFRYNVNSSFYHECIVMHGKGHFEYFLIIKNNLSLPSTLV